MPNYCIYLRKSRADREAELHGEGETLARHERTLIDLAHRKKLNITAIYKEIVSGETIASRPEMQKLLSEVEQGIWDGVLVMEVERLARGDTKDQGTVAEAFKYSNTKIITPNKVYDPNNEFDEEYFEFGLFMSRREYKTINRRIQRGRIAAIQEGKYIASTPPYGYNICKIKDSKGYFLEINPEKADTVKLIYKLYTDNENKPLGMASIAKYLDNLNIKPEKSTKWSSSTIKDILTNPVYIGKIRWQWRKEVKSLENGQIIKKRPKDSNCMLIDGLHQPIIDEITFYKAQKILKTKGIYPIVSNKELKNPLTGLIYCGKCNRPLTRVKSGKKDNYYRLKCPNPYCDNISSPLELIEASIISFLSKWINEYEIEWLNTNQNEVKEDFTLIKKLIKSAEKDIEVLKKQLENIYNLLEQGVYTTEKFVERNKYISEKIEEEEKRLNNLRNEYNENKKNSNIQKNFIPAIKKVIDLYYTLESAEKRNRLLKNVISKIVYTKNTRAKKNEKNKADFELDIFPKIPKK